MLMHFSGGQVFKAAHKLFIDTVFPLPDQLFTETIKGDSLAASAGNSGFLS